MLDELKKKFKELYHQRDEDIKEEDASVDEKDRIIEHYERLVESLEKVIAKKDEENRMLREQLDAATVA